MAILDEEKVMKFKRALVTDFAVMHRQMRKALEMYNGDFHVLKSDILASGKYHEVLPQTARIVVEGVAAHIKPKKFAVHFPVLGKSEKAKEQADMLEDAAHKISDRHGTMKAMSPITDAIKNAAIYGLSGLRNLYNPREWGDTPARRPGERPEEFDYREALWEAQKGTKLPFNLNAIDPLNMLPDIRRDTPSFMFETYKVKPWYLKEDFPDYEDPQPFAERDFTAFWTPEQWDYFVGGAPVMPGNELDRGNNFQQLDSFFSASASKSKKLRTTSYNPYGYVPYSLVWSGLGKNSPDGKPEQRAIGLIYPLISLLKEEARSLTAISIILQTTAMPRFLTRGAPAGGLRIGMAPGDVTELGGAEIEPFPDHKIPPDLYSMMNVLQQQIEMMLGAKVLTGMRPAGVTSAIFEEILLEQAKRRYMTFIQSLEAAYANVIAQQFFMWEHIIKEKIPGISLNPAKIAGHYHCEVLFGYEDIAEQRIKAMIARMLFQGGLFSFMKAHEYMGTEDPSEVRKELIKDNLYKDPQVIAALGMKMLEESGLQQTVDKASQRVQDRQRINTPISSLTPSPEEATSLQEIITKGVDQRITQPGFGGGGFEGGGGDNLGGNEGGGV